MAVPPNQQMPSKDALQRLIDGLQTLIREHLALARAEVKDDLRNLGRDLAVGAAGVPPLAVGYLLLMIALSFGLATWLPNWAAFGIVAAVNLGVGAFLSFVWGRRVLKQRVDLRKSGEELEKGKAWLASLPSATRPEQAPQAGPALPPVIVAPAPARTSPQHGR